MIKLAVSFTLTVSARGFKFRSPPWCNPKKAIDSRIIVTITMSGALNTSERNSIFFGFFFRLRKIVKKWFSCDKNYKSRAFCSGTHNSSTKFFSMRSVGGVTPSHLPSTEIACIRKKYIYWWARKSLEIQFYYTRLACSELHHRHARILYRTDSRNWVYWFSPSRSAPGRCDFTTIIINIIMHFNQN